MIIELNRQKIWLVILILPPVLYFAFHLFGISLNFNGHCSGLLDAEGMPCSYIQYLSKEILSTFFLPFFVFLTGLWLVIVGIIYLGIKIAANMKKPIKN
jgi:hypothetical protein